MNFQKGDKVKVFNTWDGEIIEPFENSAIVRHNYHIDFKDIILEQCYGNEVLTPITSDPTSETVAADVDQETKSKK